MIQRIQSVYLVVAAICLVLPILFSANFISIQSAELVYHLTPVNVVLENQDLYEPILDSYPIVGALILSLFLTVYAIGQFKSRTFQLKLVQVALMVQLVLVGLFVYFGYALVGLVEGEYASSYSPFLAVPIVSVVLYFLAIRGIKKDEALVRSADRLR